MVKLILKMVEEKETAKKTKTQKPKAVYYWVSNEKYQERINKYYYVVPIKYFSRQLSMFLNGLKDTVVRSETMQQ